MAAENPVAESGREALHCRSIRSVMSSVQALGT